RRARPLDGAAHRGGRQAARAPARRRPPCPAGDGVGPGGAAVAGERVDRAVRAGGRFLLRRPAADEKGVRGGRLPDATVSGGGGGAAAGREGGGGGGRGGGGRLGGGGGGGGGKWASPLGAGQFAAERSGRPSREGAGGLIGTSKASGMVGVARAGRATAACV